jgi:hypothetical protein
MPLQGAGSFRWAHSFFLQKSAFSDGDLLPHVFLEGMESYGRCPGLVPDQTLSIIAKSVLIPINHKHHTLRDMACERLPV